MGAPGCMSPKLCLQVKAGVAAPCDWESWSWSGDLVSVFAVARSKHAVKGSHGDDFKSNATLG